MIDGKIIVDRDFDVGNQHDYFDYLFILTQSKHTIHAKSKSEEAELEIEFKIDEQKWVVLSYWYYEDDPHPFFEFEVYDTSVGFA